MTPRLAKTLQSVSTVIFGSWKIRHDEPLDEADYVLHAVAADDAIGGDMTVAIDIRGSRRLLASWQGTQVSLSAPGAKFDCTNRSGRLVPLAFALLYEDRIDITHLVTRTDPHRSLFIRHPKVTPQPENIASLLHALKQAFTVNHLALNNWECRYEYTPAAIVERFDIPTPCDARTLGEDWYDTIDSGALAPFTTQCGDEFQLWDHDVTACQAIPHGYVGAEHWSRKRKNSLDEAVVQLTHSENGQTGNRTETIVEAVIEAPIVESIAVKLDMPLQALGEYRRMAFTTECESVDTGHIFSVTFETCISLQDHHARITRGAIRFLKTRGHIDRASIDMDLHALRDRLQRFLRDRNLDTLPSHNPFAFLGAASTTLLPPSLPSIQ